MSIEPLRKPHGRLTCEQLYLVCLEKVNFQLSLQLPGQGCLVLWKVQVVAAASANSHRSFDKKYTRFKTQWIDARHQAHTLNQSTLTTNERKTRILFINCGVDNLNFTTVIIHASVDKPNSCLPISHRRRTTVSFETLPILGTNDRFSVYRINYGVVSMGKWNKKIWRPTSW